jgi:hypothetical protein
VEALTVAEFEVAESEMEEYVAEHNLFFKQTGFTLDDMNVYGGPLASVLQAAYSLAHGDVTEEQAFDAMRLAAAGLKAIDDRLKMENAAW